MVKRLSRRRLVVIFVVSLLVGIGIRLAVLPPTISLTGTESQLVGTWDVVDSSDDTTSQWRFSEMRIVVKSNDDDGIWKGRWRVKDGQLQIDDMENLSRDVKLDESSTTMSVQFADSPGTMNLVSEDGTRLLATKVSGNVGP